MPPAIVATLLLARIMANAIRNPATFWPMTADTTVNTTVNQSDNAKSGSANRRS